MGEGVFFERTTEIHDLTRTKFANLKREIRRGAERISLSLSIEERGGQGRIKMSLNSFPHFPHSATEKSQKNFLKILCLLSFSTASFEMGRIDLFRREKTRQRDIILPHFISQDLFSVRQNHCTTMIPFYD